MDQAPCRGEVWLIDLNPTRGHEQAGKRPCLIMSVDAFNQSPAGLAIVLPLTTKAKGIRSHIEINPPQAGLKAKSFIKCENVRSVSSERLLKRWGAVPPDTLAEAEDKLRILLGL